MTANITIASNATTGAGNVTVTNPDTTKATGSGVFTVNAGPTVESATPGSRGQGASKQVITIKGKAFVTGAKASFGAGITVESTSLTSATELKATISVESSAATGTRSVTVTNLDEGVSTLASGFTVNAGPTVSSPSSGTPAHVPHNGEAPVSITGTNFVSGLAVTFSGSEFSLVGGITFNSSSSLTIKVKESGGSERKSDLTVTNPDGGSVTCSQCIATP
jgi:hypothetical protein